MRELLKKLDLSTVNSGTFGGSIAEQKSSALLSITSPIDQKLLAKVKLASISSYNEVVKSSFAAFQQFKSIPAPKRGELVGEIGAEIKKQKELLAQLISLEAGKIYQEALGEVQEAIDMADFAVGLSRQLYGLSMHSERPQHRMYEQWHPLGPVGVITAFNFPLAVWAWNAFIAAICGDTVIWKPSERTPLIAIVTTKICEKVCQKHGVKNIFSLVVGDKKLGEKMASDNRIPLISATGSCKMGRAVGEKVAARFGRSLLELGGNNAVIVLADADLDLAIKGIFFGSVGTAGQRCTTTRRVLVEKSIFEEFTCKLIEKYKGVRIGNPLDKQTLVGPLISQESVTAFKKAILTAQKEGGKVLYGGKTIKGNYVEPTIILAHKTMRIIKEETFAPILYLLPVDSLEHAIEINNAVPQGLSSAIFSNDIRKTEKFLSALGSDCGIANVNIGTSGAEIGGAFGGEKETGGGREAGSDSWKAYMRRQTTTINWGIELPLAQGVKFE